MQSQVRILAGALAIALAGGLTATAVSQAQPASPSISYTADGKLIAPKDYRSWVYLSTGMDMSYSDVAGVGDSHTFDNVFVNREAYAAYQKTGTWPDKTIFVLEARAGQQRGSINKKGVYQGSVLGAEVHVKDTARFKSGWAFFPINANGPTAALPQTSACNTCHEQHGAVDTTFVQFYPTLQEKAAQMKTYSAAYLAEETAAKAK